MIKLQIIGHLGKDCVTSTVNGKSVMNFTVAHTEKFKDAQGNPKDRTIWVDCAYWTERTALAPYLKKGTQIYAEGSPDLRTYPKNDGTTGATITLRVMNVQLLGSKGDNPAGEPLQNGGYTSQQKPASNPMSDIPESVDDLPF